MNAHGFNIANLPKMGLLAFVVTNPQFDSAARCAGCELEFQHQGVANAHAPLGINISGLSELNLPGAGEPQNQILGPLQFEENRSQTNDSELESIFLGLAKNWQSETGAYSLTYRRFANPTYHALLVFAENNKTEVIPLVLRELKERPDWWFEALKYLTGKDPTKKGNNFNEAAKAWLEWGRAEKLTF
jgi:hypothetical protein